MTIQEPVKLNVDDGGKYYKHDELVVIAKVCYQANKAYCETIGDHTQKDWDEAAEWQRDSAILGVIYALTHPDAPASAQHDAWSVEKIKEGWVHGYVKDAEKKTHPCLVPYQNLPIEQQKKDSLFKGIVNGLK